MIDLNRFSNSKREDKFHSSGHAKIGASSGKLFGERKRIDESRKTIGGYRHARLVKRDRFSYNNTSNKSQNISTNARLDASSGVKADKDRSSTTSRQAFNSGGSSVRGSTMSTGRRFQEPTGRNYNPYS